MGKKNEALKRDSDINELERKTKRRKEAPPPTDEAVSDVYSEDDEPQPRVQFISPIAQPILEGKLLDRAIKLLKKSILHEQNLKNEGKLIKANARQIKRGVAEVTKAIRKGQKGIVFIACDVYPIDIVAHLPVFCEDQNVLYCFLSNRRTLGDACRTKRPASVIMIGEPTEMPMIELYEKFAGALKTQHPFF